MSDPNEGIDVPAGLTGVIAADTTIGQVRGREGFYHYRQYDATELARHRTVEDVWHLLLHGQLPDAEASVRFGRRVRDARELPSATRALLPAVAAATTKGAPLADLRTVASALAGQLGFGASHDLDAATVTDQTIQLAATFPTVVAAIARLRAGEEAVRVDPDLGLVAGYLQMLTGRPPRDEHVRALERYLVTTIDHGFNASTFATRVVVSTGADVGSGLIAGLGALSGPLHGGAPSRALDMLDDIGTVDRAADWARAAVDRGERIMGFGHRVYRTEDPRAALMRETAIELGGPRIELALGVEQAVLEVLAEGKPGRELYANVEYYAAVVLDAVGLPRELFTSTFAISRAIGWSAHVVEQHAARKLIRPTARYVGPPAPEPVPVSGAWSAQGARRCRSPHRTSPAVTLRQSRSTVRNTARYGRVCEFEAVPLPKVSGDRTSHSGMVQLSDWSDRIDRTAKDANRWVPRPGRRDHDRPGTAYAAVE